MTPEQRSIVRGLVRQAQVEGIQHVHEWLCERTDDVLVREEAKRLLAHQPTNAESVVPEVPPRHMAVDPMLGLELGGFRIERLIGSGGMGRVYEGTREGQPSRAAVKVLSRGGVTDITMRRFQQESAILAKLDHPGIARLHASGLHDDGQAIFPWFAMEFIDDGIDLTDWASRQSLPLRGRLELFVRVCDAISHAHAQGIVHRDLKPGNILVDVRAQVKVIDFGIARAAQEDSSRFGVRTETGQLVGTLQYMSPEQCLGQRDRIDARTDVYALGMILFELLTETYPYDVRGVPVAEAIQTVSRGKVPDLREAMPQAPDALTDAVSRCLAKDPGARHADAGALATALRTVLVPKPVTVATQRPGGAGQRSTARGSGSRGSADAAAGAASTASSTGAPGSSRLMGIVIALLSVALLLAALDVFGVVDVRGLASRVLGR
ncbi:MAG: serine/threonine protein kinase [Planctomycetes bacterium]|nr:serine/threonine protein kinase [Planctomycetota bacterium]